MDNLSDYITVFTQTPLAVIQMYFIFKIMQNHQEFIKEVMKILKRESK